MTMVYFAAIVLLGVAAASDDSAIIGQRDCEKDDSSMLIQKFSRDVKTHQPLPSATCSAIADALCPLSLAKCQALPATGASICSKEFNPVRSTTKYEKCMGTLPSLTTTCVNALGNQFTDADCKNLVKNLCQATTTTTTCPPIYDFPFPSYLEALDPSDPEFSSLQESAQKFAVNKTFGGGGIFDYLIVRTKVPVPMNRVYGGQATECGYWWMLPYNTGNVPVSFDQYRNITGVCPGWNAGTNVVSCMVPKGWAFVMGQGQSVFCPNGQTIYPPGSVFQVNGDVCSAANDAGLTCETCIAKNDLVDSECWGEMQQRDEDFLRKHGGS